MHLAVLVGRPDAAVHGGSNVEGDDEAVARWDAPPADTADRAAELIAAGAGRRRLSRELGVSEYEARQLLARTRPLGTDTAPQDVTGPAASGAGPASTTDRHVNGPTIGRTS